MKKFLYTLISLVLAAALLIAPMSVAAETGSGVLTECGGDCDYCPTIVVPGILQTQAYLQTKDGQDMLSSDGSPIMESMDMKYFVDSEQFKKDILTIIPQALLMLLTGRDCGLTKRLTKVFDANVKMHYFNQDGTRITPVKIQDNAYSVKEAENYKDKFRGYLGNTDYTQKDAALREVNVSEYGEIAGYDHLYFFWYESFGDIYDIARRFNDYVQLVKAQTGHDKVNIAFISLGGAVGTAYLDAYFNPDDVNRIVFIAAAVDGTTVMSDVFAGKLTLTDFDLLYTDFLPSLIGTFSKEYEWLGGLGAAALRLLPQNRIACLQSAVYDTLKATLLDRMFTRCSTMWALVPSSEYPALSQKYLSDPASAPLKAVTDRYYKAQKNNPKTIANIVKNTDVEIMNVCGYGLDIPAILHSYYTETSDNVINTRSASMGAKIANPGETLGANYRCAKDVSYLSPDGTIDAGAGYLPDTTWYVKNQSHFKLQSSKDVIHFCVVLLANNNIHDIESSGFPQFNEFRDSDHLYWLIDQFTDKETGEMNEAKLSAANPTAEQRVEFVAAYEEAVALKAEHEWKAEPCDQSIMRLSTIARELGILDGNFETQAEYNKRMTRKNITDKLSDVLYKLFGSRSFWG